MNLLMAQPESIMGNTNLDLTPEQISALMAQADRGDGDAAWNLFTYYGTGHAADPNAEKWLNRAALLHCPGAEESIAEEIKEAGCAPGAFGATASEAYENLLKSAAQTDGHACYELACAYAQGDPVPMNLEKARFYYEQGARLADRMCWEALSQYLHEGKGGAQDDASAYYWIALVTRCVHPDSMAGQAEWAKREEIAKSLSLDVLEQQWERIDAYVSQVHAGKIIVPDALFANGLYRSNHSTVASEAADEREEMHRSRMEAGGMSHQVD